MTDRADSLPLGWATTVLEEVAVVLQGQSPPGRTYNRDRVGLPFLQGSAEFGERHPVPVKWCSQPVRVVRPGDILISIRAPVGPTNVADQAYCIGRGLAAVRASKHIDPDFILHQLRHTVATLLDQSTGTTFDAIGGGALREHMLTLAPGGEQQRIVEAVESHLSRLDAAVEGLQRAQEKLKAYRASVLKAAVEGRLVPTEAELARKEGRSYEPADVLLVRLLKGRRRRWEEAELAKMKAAGRTPKDERWRAKYSEPGAPDVDSLPSLPEGWQWVTMGLLIGAQQNGLYVPAIRYGSGVPILRIDDYQWDTSRSAAELKQVAISRDDAHKYGLRIHDIVLNRVNSMTHLGKALVISDRHVPAVFESNMMRIELLPSVSPSFVQLYLSSSLGRSRLTKNAKWAVNQASINQSDVASCVVPLPPLAEQMRIVAEVERLLSVATASADALSASSKRCTLLRQSVLKWAFAGRLVDQDAGEESAESLLARIRAERAASTPVTQRRSRNMQAAS